MRKRLLSSNKKSIFNYFLTICFICLLGIGSVWGETYQFGTIPTGWSTSGGTQSINNIAWTYSSSSYIGLTSNKIQIGSKNNPQTSTWTISTPIGSFGSNIKITAIRIQAYTTDTTATYDISVGGTSVKSGSLATSSTDYNAENLSATSGNIVISMKGSSSSKAMYLSNIQITYEEVTITAPHTVSLHSGTAGTQLTETSGGAGVTLPSLSSPCPEYSFHGWSTSSTTITPSEIIPAGPYHPTANIDLYAVFGKSGEKIAHTDATSFSSPNADWTVEQSGGTTYWKIFQGDYIKSPTIDLGSVTSITVQMGTFGTVSNNSNILDIQTSNSTSWKTVTATTNDQSNSYTVNINDGNFALSGNGTLTFKSQSTSTSVGLRILSITIQDSVSGISYTLTPNCIVATPTFTPAPGTYTSAQDIVISCATDGADIYYTTDGTTPTDESTQYTAGATGLHYESNVTIKAIAIKTGMDDSEIGTAEYIFNIPTETYTVTLDAGTGSCTIPSITQTTAGASVNLPAATPATICASEEGYTFAGWATEAVSETTTAPTLLSGSYTPTNDITLYAVYKKTDSESDANYHKVTSALTDWSGEYLIVNEEKNAAFDGSLSTLDATNNYITVAVADNTIASSTTTDNSTFTIASVENGYSIKSASGQFIGKNDDSNGLSTNNSYSATYKNTISYDNGNIEIDIVSNGGGYLRFNSAPNQMRFRYYKSGQDPIQLYKKSSISTTTTYNSNPICLETVATPVISVASGEYNDDQSVTLSCATEGASIYYTLDGTEPSESSTLYASAITIDETATLKAKAFKTDCNASETASADYVLPVKVATIAAFKTAGESNDEVTYKITGDLTVTFASGHNTYVQDATGGLLIYDNNLTVPTYNSNDIVSNIIGTYSVYQGTPEISLTAVPAASTTTGTVTPVVVTIADFNTNFSDYQSNLVKVEDIHFCNGSTYTAGTAGSATTMTQGDNNVKLYNNFKTLNTTLNQNDRADVVGIALQFNNTKEIAPRANNDITIKTVYGDTNDVAECDSYIWTDNDNTEYTTSGLKTYTIAMADKDSVATINLTINQSQAVDTVATACETFTWHGITYTETPAVAPTFTDHTVAGCDSVITLRLTIYSNPTVSIISEPAQDFLCEGESMTLSVDGASEAQVVLNEDFASCSGNESTEISPLTTFPTLSKIFPTASGNEVKMGSGSYIGKLTSATLDLSSPFIVTLSAKRYSATENGPIQVTVNGVTKSIATLSENYQTYTLKFDAATAHSTVTIATTTASMRAYLNAVNITVPGAGILWSTEEETSSISVTPTTTTTYEVIVEDEHHCLGYASKEVTVYDMPTAVIEGAAYDTICPNTTKVFTAQNGNETNFTYQWYKDNVTIDGATHSTYTLNEVTGEMSGAYTVVVTNLSGTCKDSSAAVNLLVNGPGAPNFAFSISAPADIYDTIRIGYCEVSHTFVDPTAEHYLAGTPFGEITFDNNLHATSYIYDTPGDYTINWTGSDNCGNTATCSQVLHIAYEPCPVAEDYDNNLYPSVRINCECWTTTNLKSTSYSDGSAISNVMSYQSDEHTDIAANVATYGQLYTWSSTVSEGNTALSTPNDRGHIQGVCPEGWYLPTTDQIQGLLGTYTMNNLRFNNYWLDGGGDNASELSLVPGGMFNANTNRFENLGGNCYLWSAYEYDASTAKTFEADCHCWLFKIYDSVKDMGYSVRCIKERE